MTYQSMEKLDDVATSGLLGTADSLAYRVHEIERHLHSSASWFGAAATPSGETHVADRIGPGIAAFRLDAGNETWGDWVQILGSDDTPARTSQVYFDPHEIVVTAAERTAVYFVQIGRGTSGAAALAAATYTEVVFDTTNKAGGVIVSMQTGRAPVGSKLWARCLAIGFDTGTLDMYLGIHEYQG